MRVPTPGESLGLAPGVRVRSPPPRAATRPRLGRAHDHPHLHPAAPRSHHPSTHPGNWPARRLPPPFHPPLRAGGGTAAIRGPSAAAAGQGGHRRACARAPVGDASRGSPARDHRWGLPFGPECPTWLPPSRSHRPARRTRPAVMANLPAGRRWPGGFSPLYILSDPIWRAKVPASLKLYKSGWQGHP